LGNSPWLQKGSQSEPPEGIWESLAILYITITKDPRLRNAYTDLQLFVLDGANSKDREAILQAFHECPTPACLLTLVSVSGEGLNMTCAADGILISPTYTVSSEEQFVRRMFRSGQQLPVRLQVLCFSDTIEEGISGYSERKNRAVAAVIDGRPLSAQERAIVEDDFASVKRNGPIAYESLTPRQKALWILRKLKGIGKEGVRSFLYADDGKYATDFARGYPADEATSTSGNTARLVATVIDRFSAFVPNCPLVIGDIACGCRTLERMFEGSRDLTVRSVDINEAAFMAGAELLKSPVVTGEEEVRTMDDLPFSDDSLDIGVISLALDMTQHSRKRGDSGRERIAALSELNRALKPGGKAILTLQGSLFSSAADFDRFVSTIEQHFGFTRVSKLTGDVTAYNDAESEGYAGWLITLEKTSTLPRIDLNSDELWRGLRFPKVARDVPEYRRPPKAEARKKNGAYQDTFTIGGEKLRFQTSTMRQCEVDAGHRREHLEHERLGVKVAALLASYGTIKDIPAELLLSITPDDVDRSTQSERNAYYQALIAKFGSEELIPTDLILSRKSHILVRRTKKTKQGERTYLCLAKLSEDGKRWGSYGPKYFYD
jgi:SAM-dependent methyltransferase